MNLHAEFMEQIESRFGERLEDFPALKQDALTFRLEGGIDVEIRYAGPSEYALTWTAGEALLRIDTAPLHRSLATFPNHLHDADGRVRSDPVTHADAAPWENVRALIEAVLEDPRMEGSR